MCNSGTEPLCVHCLTEDRKVTAALAGAMRMGRAPTGLGPQSPQVLRWQTVSTGSPAPVAFPTAGQRDL